MKKKMQSILSLALAVLMLMSVVPLSANAATYSGDCGAQGDNVTWEIDADQATLFINGIGDMADYSSPWETPWNTYIEQAGFSYIIIGDGVTSVGDNAFRSTNALRITLSASVEDIGIGAFRNNINIIVDENSPYLKIDNYGVVYSADGKTLIYASKDLHEYTVPEGVEEISAYAFYYSVSFWTGYEDFVLTLPASVKTVSPKAFFGVEDSGFSIAKFFVDENNPYLSNDEFGVLFDKNKKILYLAPLSNKLGRIPNIYFIPETVKEISDYAFYGRWSESILITENVTKIGAHAFTPASEISRLYIPKTVTELDDDFISGAKYNHNHVVYFEGTQTEWDNLYKGSDDTFTVYFDHNHVNDSVTETCTQRIYTCVVCKTVNIVEDLGDHHDWYTSSQFPACFDGTAIYSCLNCSAEKEVYIAPTEEHSWYTEDNIPPCTGGTAHYYCSGCWSEKDEYVAPTEDHRWEYSDDRMIWPCVGGTVHYHCYWCNAKKEEYIAPTGEHSWVSDTYIYPCLGGTADYWCEYCGTTKSEYIAPTSDHYNQMFDCGEYDYVRCEGGDLQLYCFICYNDYVIHIEAEGHQYQFVSDNNATCTEDGTKRKECSRCNDIAETVVDVGSKLGHDLTETTVLSQQSCTQDGISVQACKRCAEIFAIIEGAYGHFDNDGDGKCDECKVVLEVILPDVPSEPGTDVTPENPEHTHSFAREVIFAPGCVTAGEQEFTCSCGEIYRAIIPAVGHTDENADSVCDLCTEDLIGNDADSDADSDAGASDFLSKILEFFNKIAEFFKKLFGIA